jgi:hypothetical protein
LDKTHEALQAKVSTIEADHTPKKDLQDSESESSELELDNYPKPKKLKNVESENLLESESLPSDSE